MCDAVVIGAGPNGLVAANVLADAGWSVVLLEAGDEPGGAVRTGELIEPGFRHDLFSAFYPLAFASPALRDLRLDEYGLRWRRAPLALAHPLSDGRCAVIGNAIEETKVSLDWFSPDDGNAWEAMIREWEVIESPLLRALFGTFPPLVPLAGLVRALGLLGIERFARHALLPVRRMGEERFEGEGARLLLAGCALHADLSPESAGSGFYGWLLCCLGQRFGFPVPEGGASALTAALVSRFESRGGTVFCQTPAREIVVRAGRAIGVRARSGELFSAARAVLADVPAPTLYRDLVAAEYLPTAIVEDLQHFQWDMATVKVDWTLNASVPWSADPARRAGTVHIADDLDNLTEFAAEIAMGRLPARPFVVFGQQSLADPSRSPLGTETAWAYTHVPRRIRRDGGRSINVEGFGEREEWLDEFVARIEERVEQFAPGFGRLIRGRHVFSPRAMAIEDPSLVGGAIGGGTSQLHQQLLLRPLPGMGRSETPIAGLYLASSSAHPGGGVHGAAGANAAHAARQRAPRLRSAVFGRGGPSVFSAKVRV